MPKIRLKKFNTYYELHGSGKENLVLIPGLKGNHTAWMPILENLSLHHQVLIFDNRGAGQADSPDRDYSIQQMSDDTMELIRHLKISNPILIGHSMGGAIAQTIAKKYKHEIKAMALCNTFSKLNDRSSQIFNNKIDLHKNNNSPSKIFQTIISEVFSEKFLSTPGIIDCILKMVDEEPYPQTYAGFKGQMAALNQFDSGEWLHELQLPTLILHAEEDSIVTMNDVRILVEKIAYAKFNLIPGGHASQIEQPEVVYKILNDFIININKR